MLSMCVGCKDWQQGMGVYTIPDHVLCIYPYRCMLKQASKQTQNGHVRNAFCTFNNTLWISIYINKNVLQHHHHWWLNITPLCYSNLFNLRHLECFQFLTISNSDEVIKILAKRCLSPSLGNNCCRIAVSKGLYILKAFD